MNLPRIGLTMGDPAGVGPEICLKAVGDPEIQSICQPIIFGDLSVLTSVAQQLDIDLPDTVFGLEHWDRVLQTDRASIVDFESIHREEFHPGQINAKTGDASFHYFNHAITLALMNKIDAISTGPIHKEALHLAGHNYPGHTEILADRCGTDDFCMMLTSNTITCSFVTTHVGLHQVPDLIRKGRIVDVIRLTTEAMKRIRGRDVNLVCCGLNPHAGEGGLFGQQEEERQILPAIQESRKEGISVEGPLPADTAFVRSKRETTDAYVCMYHDQGNIPLKALAFDEAVNITLGLPVLRTSVDHGTACDIAWQGIANHQSMVEAIKLAAFLSRK